MSEKQGETRAPDATPGENSRDSGTSKRSNDSKAAASRGNQNQCANNRGAPTTMNNSIASFTPTDVVLGKGNGINSLPGNINFRQLINKYKSVYAKTPRNVKASIAEMILTELSQLNPPGRFLEAQDNKRFKEVSRRRAIEKTCQALREKKSNISPQQPQQPPPLPQPQQNNVEDVKADPAAVKVSPLAERAAIEVSTQTGLLPPSPRQQQTPPPPNHHPYAHPGNAGAVAPVNQGPPVSPAHANMHGYPNHNMSHVPPEQAPAHQSASPDMDEEEADQGDVSPQLEDEDGNPEPVWPLMENDVLYGGRGRKHFHRAANQRFLDLIKFNRQQYEASRSKKRVAQGIIMQWRAQTPPGRFLQQDTKDSKWYEIPPNKILEKTCQALRDLKRERGPGGTRATIADRMVDMRYEQGDSSEPHNRHSMMQGHPGAYHHPHHHHHPHHPSPPPHASGAAHSQHSYASHGHPHHHPHMHHWGMGHAHPHHHHHPSQYPSHHHHHPGTMYNQNYMQHHPSSMPHHGGMYYGPDYGGPHGQPTTAHAMAQNRGEGGPPPPGGESSEPTREREGKPLHDGSGPPNASSYTTPSPAHGYPPNAMIEASQPPTAAGESAAADTMPKEKASTKMEDGAPLAVENDKETVEKENTVNGDSIAKENTQNSAMEVEETGAKSVAKTLVSDDVDPVKVEVAKEVAEEKKSSPSDDDDNEDRSDAPPNDADGDNGTNDDSKNNDNRNDDCDKDNGNKDAPSQPPKVETKEPKEVNIPTNEKEGKAETTKKEGPPRNGEIEAATLLASLNGSSS